MVSFIKEELCTFDRLIYIMNSQKKNMVYRVPEVFDLGFFFKQHLKGSVHSGICFGNVA